jgi:methylmalonyl-CoA epimerase
VAARSGTHHHAFMPPGRIHHVGVVVPDLSEAVEEYRKLGFLAGEVVRLAEQNVDVAAIRAEDSWIELISPVEEDSGIGRFLANRGKGIHHVAYVVDDLAETLAGLAAGGVELIDREPRVGLHGWRIAFVHPRSCAGVLTELVERASTEQGH